jgi:hypothetical protein
MVYMRWSLGGPCSDALWTMAVSWSQRSFGRSPAALFLHYVSDGVGLDRPPPSGPSRVFLVVKEVGSKG